MAAREWISKAERNRYPRIMGMISSGWTRFSELTLGKLLMGGIGIRLPVFTGGYNKEQIEQAKVALSEAEIRRDRVLQQIRLEVGTAYNRQIEALKSVQVNAEIVEQSEIDLRKARVELATGLGDTVGLKGAEFLLKKARNDRARSLYDYQISKAELEYSVGKRP